MKADKIKRSKKRRAVRAALSLLILGAFAFTFFPPKGYIPVLMYHFVVPKHQVGPTSLDVSVDDFRRQMWFLKTFRYRAISLDEFYAIKTGQAKARGKEVVVTFDDGNETYLQYALPILERYQVPSANFLVWNYVERKEHGSMSLEDAKRISNHPLVTLGSHTLSHPNLQEASARQAYDEITQSKEKLESVLNKKIYYFSYPGGSFSPKIMQMVQEAGYRLAFRTAMKHFKNYPQTLHSIARIKISPRQNLFIFWLNISGIINCAKRIEAFFLHLTAHNSSGTLNVYKLPY